MNLKTGIITKVKRKAIWLISIILILASSCTTPKKLLILPDRKSGELVLSINPAKKTFGLGIVIFKPLSLTVEIPESIKSLMISNSNGQILWHVEAKLPEFGGHGLRYGLLNKKEYYQVYPESGTPEMLIEGKNYTIEMETVEYVYIKEFKYQHSIVFISEKDKK